MSMELTSVAYYNEPTGPAASSVKGERLFWSTGLTWVCILCVLIGLTGLLSGALGFAVLIAKKDQTAATQTVTDAKSARAAELQKETEAIQSRFLPAVIFQEMFKTVLAGAFLASAMLLFVKKRGARSFVVMVCCGALLYHLGNAALNFLMLNSVMGLAAEKGLEAAKNLSAEQKEAAASFFSTVGFSMSIFSMIIFAVRCFFYAGVIHYMTRPHVREVFGEDPYPELTEMAAAGA